MRKPLGPLGPFPVPKGSLSRQYSVCGKPGCACADPDKPKKHGPFYQLSYAHQGKSSTRFVRPGYVPQIKKELAAYKRFRQLTQTWVALEITRRAPSPYVVNPARAP
jgi:hypothetical protein